MHSGLEPDGRKRKRSLLWLSISGSILLLVTFVGWAATNNAPADDPVAVPLNVESREAGAFLQGGSSRRIPVSTDFTLMLFDGKKLALSDLQGKPVVLNFWASWCPPCRAEARGLERVWQAYKDKDIIFLGVDIQDNEADARAFLKEFGVTYPNGQDTTNEIAFGYGVSGIPTTVLITRDGRVARRWVGAIGEKQLAVFIEEML